MKQLAQKLKEEKCKNLIKHIAVFLRDHQKNPEFTQECIHLIKFCKKLSKQSAAHEYLVEAKIHDITMQYISNRDVSKKFIDMEELELK